MQSGGVNFSDWQIHIESSGSMIQNFHFLLDIHFFLLFQFSSEIGSKRRRRQHRRRRQRSSSFAPEQVFDENFQPRLIEKKKLWSKKKESLFFFSLAFSRQNGQPSNHQRVLVHHVSLHRCQPLQQQQPPQQQRCRRRRWRRRRQQQRKKLPGLEAGEVWPESGQRIRPIENLLSPVERIRRKPHPVDF